MGATVHARLPAVAYEEKGARIHGLDGATRRHVLFPKLVQTLKNFRVRQKERDNGIAAGKKGVTIWLTRCSHLGVDVHGDLDRKLETLGESVDLHEDVRPQCRDGGQCARHDTGVLQLLK